MQTHTSLLLLLHQKQQQHQLILGSEILFSFCELHTA
jgi:hypothetical protein